MRHGVVCSGIHATCMLSISVSLSARVHQVAVLSLHGLSGVHFYIDEKQARIDFRALTFGIINAEHFSNRADSGGSRRRREVGHGTSSERRQNHVAALHRAVLYSALVVLSTSEFVILMTTTGVIMRTQIKCTFFAIIPAENLYLPYEVNERKRWVHRGVGLHSFHVFHNSSRSP